MRRRKLMMLDLVALAIVLVVAARAPSVDRVRVDPSHGPDGRYW